MISLPFGNRSPVESHMASRPLTEAGHGCEALERRTFLLDMGMGFWGLALGAMLQRDGVVRADGAASQFVPDGQPHFAPRAKRIIWLMMRGGVSHTESFDPKPELNRHAGKTLGESPFGGVLASP